MKIIISPDSFKGSISAKDAAHAIARGLKDGYKGELEAVEVPIADGGEGTLEAMVLEGELVPLTVTGPRFSPVSAAYGRRGDSAVIEMARAAGLTLVSEDERSAKEATTYGVGELILHAAKNGARHILLTVGGSATNDGGAGMLCALGARFTDKDGNAFIPTGGTLADIARIDVSGLSVLVRNCRFTLATDVKNPLLGRTGATRVYAEQKGASPQELDEMEGGMAHYAALLAETAGKDIASLPGCGAGGGLGAPLLALLSAEITSGIEAVLKTLRFDTLLEGADAVITGEGKMDAQSLYGKAISGVVRYAAAKGIPVYCFVGCVEDDPALLKQMGIADIFTTVSLAPSPEASIANAGEYLYRLGTLFGKKLRAQKAP